MWPVSLAIWTSEGYFHTKIWFCEYPWVLTYKTDTEIHFKSTINQSVQFYSHKPAVWDLPAHWSVWTRPDYTLGSRCPRTVEADKWACSRIECSGRPCPRHWPVARAGGGTRRWPSPPPDVRCMSVPGSCWSCSTRTVYCHCPRRPDAGGQVTISGRTLPVCGPSVCDRAEYTAYECLFVESACLCSLRTICLYSRLEHLCQWIAMKSGSITPIKSSKKSKIIL